MRRTARAVAVVVLALAGFLLVPAGHASAHPLGNFTINLYAGVTVVPGHIRVSHVLDMAEIPTFQELPRIDTDHDGTATAAERSTWASATSAELARGLVIELDGRRIPLSVGSTSMRLLPGQAGLSILRLQTTYVGRTEGTGELSIEERNYADRIGWREITAVGANGSVVSGSSVPATSVSDALRSYPSSLLSSPLRVTSATLSFQPGASGPVSRVASGGEGAERPGVAGGSFAGLVDRTLSVPFVAFALLLAMGFGALHALAPGHGKTIMAAYLVGAGGRVRQAFVGGAAISLMHTASVLAVGGLILSAEQLFPPERVYPWLGVASGVVVVGLGAVLLYVRTRARRSHEHEHEHDEAHHGHDHAALDPSTPLLSRRGLAALAVSGGLLPSPTALVVLLASVALHRLAFGLALILAFSVGLAGALTAVGVVAVRARDLFAKRMRGRVGRLVPVGSAAVIVAAGAVLLARAATQL